jgi:hypothetical protein
MIPGLEFSDWQFVHYRAQFESDRPRSSDRAHRVGFLTWMKIEYLPAREFRRTPRAPEAALSGVLLGTDRLAALSLQGAPDG